MKRVCKIKRKKKNYVRARNLRTKIQEFRYAFGKICNFKLRANLYFYPKFAIFVIFFKHCYLRKYLGPFCYMRKQPKKKRKKKKTDPTTSKLVRCTPLPIKTNINSSARSIVVGEESFELGFWDWVQPETWEKGCWCNRS